ncbi:MAG: hypothetical protein A2269_01170 [Lentisphaerae bacterium RIFOXYA12_FULL_60_10]|nr:MAG: hypothetical protein A2269_01170 [Lentisphaerae bacterium RIFOXYA12_FULL_60_10]
MKLGEELRKARLDRKLTPSQVAAATRMKVQVVESLEREDFSSIAAPIYSKGFIKLYAEYVGIDPRPLIDDFVNRFVNPHVPEPQVVMEAEPVAGQVVSPELPEAGKPVVETEVDLFSHAARRSVKDSVPVDVLSPEPVEPPLFPPEVSSRQIAAGSPGPSFLETIRAGLMRVGEAISGWGTNAWRLLISRCRDRADRYQEWVREFLGRFQVQPEPAVSASLMDADVRRPVRRDTRWVVRTSIGFGVVLVVAILGSLMLRHLRRATANENQEHAVAVEVFRPVVLPPEPYLD